MAKPINQCDGCRAGIPVDENGSHRMGRPGGYSDLMGCQRDKYLPADDDEPELPIGAPARFVVRVK